MNEIKTEKVYFKDLDISEDVFDNMRIAYPDFKEWLKKMKNTNSFGYGIRNDKGKVIAFTAFKVESETEAKLEEGLRSKSGIVFKIRSLRSLEERKGYGTKLLEKAIENCKFVHLDLIYITFFDNQPYTKSLKNFLVKHGFTKYCRKSNTNELVFAINIEK